MSARRFTTAVIGVGGVAAAEDLGRQRASFYEASGAFTDMVATHLMQERLPFAGRADVLARIAVVVERGRYRPHVGRHCRDSRCASTRSRQMSVGVRPGSVRLGPRAVPACSRECPGSVE